MCHSGTFLRLALFRLCAYIMHTAQEQFIAYVFHCEPSAGALSKTIEAACKVIIQYHNFMSSLQRDVLLVCSQH